MIGAVIGPGGKVIQDIQKTTGTTITITEVDNKGIVDIFGQDKTALDGALNRIKAIVAIPEIGETYHGKIRSIVTFGAFVEIMPGKGRPAPHLGNRLQALRDHGGDRPERGR